MERGDGGAGMGPRGAAAAAMLGMEMHHSHPPQPQMHASSAFQQPEHHHGGGGGFQHHQPVPVRQHPPPSYSPSPYAAASSRAVKVGGHEEEEMGNGAGNGGGAVQQQQQPGTVGCPWSRMKWTDGMVRLLITVVYNAGDDGEGVSAGGSRTAASHGKSGASAAAAAHGHQAAAQQKKGKWKSVSRAMMENGFMVSPQQCEDKFNDLNKRYKRVVDLLGRGKACKVVENPALLDGMDELMPKAKEEARKLLSSKHLFFREMCTYHNPGAAAAASHGTDEGAACFHHPRPASVPCAATSSVARQMAAPSPAMVHSSTRAEEDDDDSDDDVPYSNEAEEEDEDDLDDEEVQTLGTKHRGGGQIDDSNRFHHHHSNGHHKRRRGEMAAEEDEDEDGNKRARRRTRVSEDGPSAVQHLQSELAAVMAAGGDPQQVRQWMRRRTVELEEQQVAYECREYQLQRQRLKWERFRANKERDMERARLRNDRLRIDGRRMLLLLRQKDLDLDIAETNYSSSVDHHTGAQTPPLPTFHHQLGSSPSTAGHPN